MLISCKKCNVRNEVYELQELNDLPEFYERVLIIGKCRVCSETIASLIEVRKKDDKVFVDSFFGQHALKVIKREQKRIKCRNTDGHRFHGFVYGLNKEIKNKKGEVVKVRQYASDFLTGKTKLMKTIETRTD